MKRFLLLLRLCAIVFFSCNSLSGEAQVTVFSDNFNTSTGSTYTIAPGTIGSSSAWLLSRSGADWGARIDGNILDLTNDGSATANVNGWVYGYALTSGFASPYTSVLSSNTGLVSWTFNMRQIRTDPAGFVSGSYGVAFVLGSTSSTAASTGNGYAVVLGQSGTTDPVRLVKYTSGLQGTLINLIISTSTGLTDFGADYLSVKVTYDKVTDTWELFLRNDGTTAFADPAVGSLTSQGTFVDNTYTGSSLDYIGAYWQGSTGATQTAFFDNVTVKVGSVTNTITVGTVSTLTFNIDCFTGGSGTVDFTSTGTFTIPNNYVAQLSDAAGSFASPTSIGSLASIANSGTINVTIPSGTPTGAGYKIRIVSDNPTITSGNTSAAIQINLSGTCSSNATDYFRSKTTGSWASTSTWESSITGTAGTWMSATLTPTSAANTIEIRNGHTVTASSAVTVDQVIVESGGTLVNQMPAANALTFADGTGDDMEIQSGGVYHVLSTQGYANYQTINAGATIRIKTGGTIRLGDGTVFAGSSNHLLAATSTSYIWENNSTFEWNSSGSFTSGGVTYFPDVNSATIPVFKTTQNIGGVGAAASTTFNSIFEANGNITFQNAGQKIFRNGIRGTGNITGSTSGAFVINGVTAELGGAGGLIVPTSAGIQIGSAANATAVTVTANKTITGDINLISTNNTYVDLGVYNLTVTGAINGATVNAFIQTSSTGVLKLTVPNSSTIVFPIGNTSFNPVDISNLSGTTADFNARVANGINSPTVAFPTYGIQRTWYIGASAVTSNVTVQFEYMAADRGTNISSTDLVEILKSDYTTWSILPGNTNIAQVGTNPYSVTTATALTIPNSASPYAIGKSGGYVLPIDCIISTRAQKRNNSGIISWNINSCADVTSFEIQRATANGAYQTIGELRPTVNQTDFNFTDISLARGTNLYRIKVNRFSGAVKYSNTVALVFDSEQIFVGNVMPNPVHSVATLNLSAANPGVADINIYDLAGKLVKRCDVKYVEGNNFIELDVSALSSGIYQIMVSTTNSSNVVRFIKQ